MSKKAMRALRDSHAWAQTAPNTFTFARSSCVDCGGKNLYSGPDKEVHALALRLGFDDRAEKVSEFMAYFGMTEMWICRDCGCFGGFPL